jgi:hypothetical protein
MASVVVRGNAANKNPALAGLPLKRMMGLEPTTFCMAKLAGVRARSRPFAETARLWGLRPERANAIEPEQTPNLAILAMLVRERIMRQPCSVHGRGLQRFAVDATWLDAVLRAQ